MIEAWSIVSEKHPEWHLDIYGEGTLKDNLQNQIDNLKLSNVVKLCDRVPNIEEKYPLYSFFVMSSRAEGFPLVLLEAASSGIPLISYDCNSGPREIIKLIDSPFLIDEMGKNAVCMVNKFSLPNITKQWLELFNDTVTSK